MQIKILRNTVAAGKTVKVGDVVEVTNGDAKTLILLGKAEVYNGDTKPAEKALVTPETKKENPTEGIEDALDNDPDLGEGQDEEIPDLASFSYESLVEMAADYGIKKPIRMNKAVLIEAIKVAQGKQA